MASRSEAADIPSSPSFDTEAASQQLLAEASSPVWRPTAAPTAAQRGANLLNAARMLPKPPVLSPAQAGRPGKPPKPGGLKRVSLSSLVSERSQKKARGKQMYDMDPSPQKKRSSLPAQTAALEDEEEETEPLAEAELDKDEEAVPETNQVLPEDDAPAEIPESRDAPAPSDGPVESGDSEDVSALPEAPQEDAFLATKRQRGRPRKNGGSTSSRLSDAGTTEAQQSDDRPVVATKSQRKARPERDIGTTANDEHSNKASKKVKQLKGPKMISPNAPEFDDDLLAPTAALRQDPRQELQQDARPRGDPQPEVRIPIRPTQSRTTRSQVVPATGPESSATAIPVAAIERKGKAAQRIARTTRSAMASSAPEAAKHNLSGEDRAVNDNTAEAEEAQNRDEEEAFRAEATTVVNTGEVDEGATDEADAGDNAHEDGLNENSDEHQGDPDNRQLPDQQEEQFNGEHDETQAQVDEVEEHQDEANAEDAATLGLQTTNGHGTRIPVLDKVFRFPVLDKVFRFPNLEERPGACSTKLGRKIHRASDRSRVTLSRSEEGLSVDDTSRIKDDLIALLRSISGKVHQERHVAFKRDAFAYLFRALTVVFVAMHDKLQEKEVEVTESLEAMQILHSYVREMLHFKDTMDSWKVVVPQHSQGDRLIKDVESSLIVPLRIVEKIFRKCLRQLKRAEESRQVLIEIQRQREEEEQEMTRREEALRSVRERRKRWQDLHIARMQCEADPYRRRRLRFVEPVDMAEIDANGNQFERVPFFGERSAPPPSSVATMIGREWTKEQETVLLDALQSSASLEPIFRKHCGPDGALRDFSVSDFAAKLAWVRFAWAQLSHQHGWDLPEWVRNIPVLP